MTIELMDGATGSKHISSEDWTVFNEATYGASEAVFDWGNRFKLTMSTANAGTLATGAGLVDGKRVWIKSPESITVTSGSQGMKRNDVVGIRYETYQSGSTTLERPVVEVVKGTPNATTATDPAIPDKFLALWCVPLDGIAVGEPVALFDVMQSIQGFRDSVSRASKVSSSVSIEANSVGTFTVDFGKDIIAITGIRSSQITMLDVSFWQTSGSVATVGVRNNGSKRTGTITVSALIRR